MIAITTQVSLLVQCIAFFHNRNNAKYHTFVTVLSYSLGLLLRTGIRDIFSIQISWSVHAVSIKKLLWLQRKISVDLGEGCYVVLNPLFCLDKCDKILLSREGSKIPSV